MTQTDYGSMSAEECELLTAMFKIIDVLKDEYPRCNLTAAKASLIDISFEYRKLIQAQRDAARAIGDAEGYQRGLEVGMRGQVVTLELDRDVTNRALQLETQVKSLRTVLYFYSNGGHLPDNENENTFEDGALARTALGINLPPAADAGGHG